MEDRWIVCGWYTPDYEHWWRKLEQSLIEHKAPYDFRSVASIAGGWEKNTLRKAGFALDAIERHPNKVIMFLDVDCVVTGNLAALSDLPCDIALDFHLVQKKRRTNLIFATGHMVLNPTAKMRELTNAWALASREAQFGSNDQESLTFAVNEVQDMCIMRIGPTARGTILHNNASAGVRKVNGHARFKHRLRNIISLGRST